MVSLWPWKGEDDSPAGFEKALSTLSGKINESTARLDAIRQRGRRFKALWTLYTTFVYLLYSIILALVLGWQNWGPREYAAVAGGPVVFYLVRSGSGRIFNYRVAKTRHHLDDLHKQREKTIEKLKVATKYNSTQQLLEKYGGESPISTPSKRGGNQDQPQPQPPQQPQCKPSTPQFPAARTGLAPPPTANIQRSPAPSPPPAPASPPNMSRQPPYGMPNTSPNLPQPPPPPPQQPMDEPGFAPNAFPRSSQYIETSHWYDRLLDVLLGEDETQPKNRIALVCRACRLVNGQAPPGMRTLEELGRWRCGGCGAWNGEESETSRVLAGIRGQAQASKGNGENMEDPVMVVANENGSSGAGAETPDEKEAEAEPETEEPRPSKKSGKGRG